MQSSRPGSTAWSLIALLSLVVACNAKTEARPGSDDPAAAAPAPSTLAPPKPAPPAPPAVTRVDGPFPIVEGTRFTFRAARRNGTTDTWETTIRAIDGASGLLQYQPHNDVATVFTRKGFSVDERGISIAGDGIDGPLAPVPAISLPFTEGAVHEVPGLFPCTYSVLAREPVVVPAGTFDAWRISIKDTVNPPGAVWIAPGTGIVKFQHSSGRVDELISITPAK